MAIFQALFAALGLREPKEVNADELGAEKIPTSPFGRPMKLMPHGAALLAAALISGLLKSKPDAPDLANSGHPTEPSVWPRGQRIDISAPRARPVEDADQASRERVLS